VANNDIQSAVGTQGRDERIKDEKYSFVIHKIPTLLFLALTLCKETFEKEPLVKKTSIDTKSLFLFQQVSFLMRPSCVAIL